MLRSHCCPKGLLCRDLSKFSVRLSVCVCVPVSFVNSQVHLWNIEHRTPEFTVSGGSTPKSRFGKNVTATIFHPSPISNRSGKRQNTVRTLVETWDRRFWWENDIFMDTTEPVYVQQICVTLSVASDMSVDHGMGSVESANNHDHRQDLRATLALRV